VLARFHDPPIDDGGLQDRVIRNHDFPPSGDGKTPLPDQLNDLTYAFIRHGQRNQHQHKQRTSKTAHCSMFEENSAMVHIDGQEPPL
jgi:hypothetical protein